MPGTSLLCRKPVRVRVLEDILAIRFRELTPADVTEHTCLLDLEPQCIRTRRLEGYKVWAQVDGLRHDMESWGVPLPAEAEHVTFSFAPKDALTLTFIIITVVNTVAQILIARQNRPSKPPSPTYTFGPIQTQALAGVPIPVVYGSHKVGGNVISQKVQIDDQGKSVLNTLLCLSEGPIASVAGIDTDTDGLIGDDIPEGIQINGVEASQIPGVEVSIRLGTPTQLPIPGFSDLTTGVPVGTIVNQNFPITYRTNGEVQALDVLITFVGGLYYQGKKLHSKSAPITIKYQLLTAEGAPINVNGWTSNSFVVTKKLLTPFTIQKSYGPLSKGFYAIEVSRDFIDDEAAAAVGQPGHVSKFQLDSVNEILLDDSISYVNSALIAVKAVATENLNGGSPNFVTQIDGLFCYVWTSGTVDNPTFTNIFTKNPAWCLLNLLTNVRYGGGEVFTLSDIDLQSFKDWADFCDEQIDTSDLTGSLGRRFELNLVLDTKEPLWDQAQKIAAAARAALVKSGRIVRVVIEREADPVQIFSVGNIIQDSFRLSYASSKDAKNFMEARFLNEDNDYAQDTATIQDPDITKLYNKEQVFLFGITKPYMAYRQAQYLFSVSNLLRRSIEFEVPVESVSCEVGDVIAIQHDIPAWGLIGGRVLDSTANTVKLDRKVPITPGATPRISVRTTAPAATWAGSTFAWSSAFGQSRAWIGVSGIEAIQTRGITQQPSAGTWAAATFTWGGSTGLTTNWGEVPAASALTVSSAWDAGDLPRKGDLYIFDKSSLASPVGRYYRVLEIRRTQHFRAALRCLEYNPAVYDDYPGVLDHKSGTDPLNPAELPPDVENLSLTEIVSVELDGSVTSSIQVSWKKPEHNLPYKNRIYLRADNIPFVNPSFALVGETNDSTFTITQEFFEVGFTYTVAVTSVALAGTEKSPNLAPDASITPSGLAPAPPDVEGFMGVQVGQSIVLSWDPVASADLSGYEIRYGSSWTSGLVIGTGITQVSFTTTNFIVGSNQYWIKAKNTTGAYSENAASTTVEAIALGAVALDQEEAYNWPGTKSNFSVVFPNLVSTTPGLTWTAATFAWNSSSAATSPWNGFAANYETPIYRPGSWESRGTDTWADGIYTWADGFYGNYQIGIALDFVAIDVSANWASSTFPWNDPAAHVSDWTGVVDEDVNPITLGLQLATSPDGTSFDPYAPFTPGIYTAKAFKSKISASSSEPQYRAKLRSVHTVATVA